MNWKAVAAILAGLFTSVVGGYAYAYLVTLDQPTIYIIAGIAVALVALAGLVFLLRGKGYLLTRSGIVAFYPRGQSQCQRLIVRELKRATKATFIGARGMDLIGEHSPFAIALQASRTLQTVEVFLLAPGGKNARLRSQHLDVEKNKYEAEGHAVDNFLGYLVLNGQIPLTKFSYTERPLFRLIETDKSTWVAFYRSGVRGKDLPIFRLAKNSLTYREVEKYRDHLRAAAERREYGPASPNRGEE